ncbi:MAG: hypothetical protein V2A58_01345 [Planctomycetota bacterium]
MEKDKIPVDPALRRERMRELARAADRVSTLILNEEYPEIDILIERANLREHALRLYPDRAQLYDMIYEARFDRLTEQFRPGEAHPESKQQEKET